ncbi:MAG TPA: 16S rRNA (guanine(966)-N(2))-methyltransferase RsmD [Rectinema sp.]|jgi:16S rRNA (guanine(966)-N(2))-methyltransferase RsmD|nr:16S rRNA (guanine(966)-N(2))-methyltransferase RsmD [Spirochaetia bacterium]MDI9428049.1 16S rRNA (guanine(966)-N(2))-methyltransferase RsmD [Spirochaetota bacterium]NLH90355.1 16S rRNA (guanine(966)-N(2))-methyltransferase RsmD [Treponema sp.]OQC75132.1 MAG: Ribosomal RNA small subunit methyltransferase D [Spirochaetes bacterium ADurb.Bin001]HNP92377.1 16S rRNA (guanine(966)-N(2))-methyltransferase RsmD [Rectinema sp.]
MRITGGEYSGRIVKVPEGDLRIRPSMDRMRQSVFDVLGDLLGYSFLDLFAGSGILGLEAASRGASPVVCVEKDRKKFPVLLQNAAMAKPAVFCKAMPAETFIMRNKQAFDIIFLDPPFDYRFKLQLLERLDRSSSIHDGSLVLIHFPREDNLPQEISGLRCYDMRIFGRSIVHFYRKI